jgi:integrase
LKGYREHVEKRRADGKLRSTSLDYYVNRYEDEFKDEKLTILEHSPRRFEQWRDSRTFATVPEGRQETHKLRPASWNRYYEVGRRIFNWAISQGYATVNPFLKFTKRPERNKRDTRISPEQEQALFDALPKLWRKRQRTEMRRRLIGAIDLGLREGEMLKIQIKHVDYQTWRITIETRKHRTGLRRRWAAKAEPQARSGLFDN